ncbi:chromate efflux transporter [Polynucleobacter asymbioticus]|uniref:Chromate transporter, chromate ion transporter (CHR) family n=2 Tax=Polynucleobacter asymbioticus TaxID=576611 RepID=A4SY90_POLAQ|nr:chromate efflux transporter [Polynucleobacter asymbioticus]ABP34454.1 chromate transporter, chromate ion transporter (CHR) family [Polynucleobacter asymbioticus QLW-P1DMWA-1]APC06297.1 chromate transporter [Polynucleobacter asymbioticus]
MSVPLREALKFWTKLGFISFGGPAGQIAVLHQELVEKRRWISERRFLHALNYCMLLPGPEAQQLVTYIGWLMHRSWGGILAGTLFVLPSLLILIALSWIYLTFGQVPWIAAIFFGIKPAITAIVMHAAVRIGKRTIHNQALKWIALGSFLAIFVLNLAFPLIVLIAAAVGIWGGKRYPEYFQQTHSHGKIQGTHLGAAIIDDDTPTPEHAQFSYQKTLLHSAVALTCWLIPVGLLVGFFGWKTLYPQLAWFFTKAAFLTFGGAYAVLPYVYQGAVDHFHWLSAGQMMDGLALGETTPGPLIMVVAFVGYLAGHIQHLIGYSNPFWFGVLGACVATWFTFLPSFFFILVGGPIIESTHGKLAFTAPLTAITATVVGVIANLGLFFAYHVFLPHGLGGSISWVSMVICGLAGLALFKLQKGVIPVLGGSALAGLLVYFVATLIN